MSRRWKKRAKQMEKEAQKKQQSKNFFVSFFFFFRNKELFSINKLLTLNPETDSPNRHLSPGGLTDGGAQSYTFW